MLEQFIIADQFTYGKKNQYRCKNNNWGIIKCFTIHSTIILIRKKALIQNGTHNHKQSQRKKLFLVQIAHFIIIFSKISA